MFERYCNCSVFIFYPISLINIYNTTPFGENFRDVQKNVDMFRFTLDLL